MRQPDTCPECGGTDNLLATMSNYGDTIECVRVCHECPTQWIVEFAEPVCKKVVKDD